MVLPLLRLDALESRSLDDTAVHVVGQAPVQLRRVGVHGAVERVRHVLEPCVTVVFEIDKIPRPGSGSITYSASGSRTSPWTRV